MSEEGEQLVFKFEEDLQREVRVENGLRKYRNVLGGAVVGLAVLAEVSEEAGLELASNNLIIFAGGAVVGAIHAEYNRRRIRGNIEAI